MNILYEIFVYNDIVFDHLEPTLKSLGFESQFVAH